MKLRKPIISTENGLKRNIGLNLDLAAIQARWDDAMDQIVDKVSNKERWDTVPNFIKWAVQENGGDYETICQQLENAFGYNRATRRKIDYSIEFARKIFKQGDWSPCYNLQFIPDEFAIKYETRFGEDNPAAERKKIAVQKSVDQPGIVLTIIGEVMKSSSNLDIITDQNGKVLPNQNQGKLTTLHFFENHLEIKHQHVTNFIDSLGNHCLRDQSNASFTFDNTNKLTHCSYSRSENDDIQWDISQSKDLSNNPSKTKWTFFAEENTKKQKPDCEVIK